MQAYQMPRDDVATHFLGDASAVVFNEATQALFAFDRTASYLWCRLLDGEDANGLAADLAARGGLETTAARSMVDACLAQWEQLALLGAEPSVAAAEAAPADALPWRDDFSAPAAHRSLLVAGARYDLRMATAEFAAALAGLLATFPDATGATDDVEGRIDIAACDDGIGIYIDGWLAGSADTLAELAPALKFHLTGDRVDGATTEVALHAGAVTWAGDDADGRDRDGEPGGVLIAGHAGAGKSTLAAGLMAAGGGHVSDDTVIFDPATELMWGFGFAIAIKEAAWPLMARRWPGLDAAPVCTRGDGLAVRYLARQRPYDGPMRADAVVFPDYHADGRQRLSRLDTVTALRQLLTESGSGAGRLTRPMFLSLAAWLERAQVFSFTYSDLDAAVAAVQALRPAPPA